MMIKVRLEVTPVNPDVKNTGKLVIQRQIGNDWRTEHEIPYVPGDKTGARVLLLDDDQRIILEASAIQEYIYDRSQGVSRPLEPEELAARAQAAASMEFGLPKEIVPEEFPDAPAPTLAEAKS